MKPDILKDEPNFQALSHMHVCIRGIWNLTHAQKPRDEYIGLIKNHI